MDFAVYVSICGINDLNLACLERHYISNGYPDYIHITLNLSESTQIWNIKRGR